MKRKNISSGAKWEKIVGYSRAVKIGNQIFVSGTTATGENGEIVGIDDIYKQAEQIFKNIETALKKAGSSLDDIVKTRTYVTNIDDWKKVGKVHSKFLGKVKPAATMVEVSRLISPEILVEIEVEAVKIN